MSNRRRPGLLNWYRSEYLRSPAWFARRERWFRDQAASGEPLTCAGCGQAAVKDELELHHLEYDGVDWPEGNWRAREAHEDLLPLHPYCHELLHRLIDRDRVLAHHRDRRAASLSALQRLRPKLQQPLRKDAS